MCLPGHSRTSPPKLKSSPSDEITNARISLLLASWIASRRQCENCRSSRLYGGLARTMWPIDPAFKANCLHGALLGSGWLAIGNNGQQEVRWPLRVVIDLVG